jgi:phospholipid/cholesterol/gamma-HCH transport system substrate-binding protein
MENKANYALVGAFATLAVGALLAFIYWFSSEDGATDRTTYAVAFTGAVTGLTTGTNVLFNGIPVGNVTHVAFDPNDPSRVLARIDVDANAPVMADTQALLEVQGLTGMANIQLLGGSADAGPLVPAAGEQVATLVGQPSDFQAIIEGAREIVDTANSAFMRLDNFMGENESRVNATLANIEQLTASLAGFAAGGDLDSRIDNFFAENETRLSATLDNAQVFSSALADNADRIDTLIASLSDAGQRIGPLADEVRVLTTDVRGLVDAIPPERLTQAIDDFGGAVASANSTLARIDGFFGDNQAGLTATIENAQVFSGALADNADGIESFLGSLAEAGDRIGPLADELRAITVDVRGLVEAVPPQRVSQAIDDIGTFTATLSRNTANIDAFFADAGTLATNLSGISEGLSTTLALIDDASAAIDPAVIERAMRNIDRFSTALGDNAGNVDEILVNARTLTETLNSAADRVDVVLSQVDSMVGSDEGTSMFAEFGETARAIRVLAENLDVRTAEITAGLSDFTSGNLTGEITEAARAVRVLAEQLDARTATLASGLDGFTNRSLSEFSNLANSARGTLQRLDRILSNVERNPQMFVFGGGQPVRDFQTR